MQRSKTLENLVPFTTGLLYVKANHIVTLQSNPLSLKPNQISSQSMSSKWLKSCFQTCRKTKNFSLFSLTPFCQFVFWYSLFNPPLSTLHKKIIKTSTQSLTWKNKIKKKHSTREKAQERTTPSINSTEYQSNPKKFT